jgi:hypothetical protein
MEARKGTMAIEDRFVGSRQLLDWTTQAGDGPGIHPQGKDVSGLIQELVWRKVS